MIFSAWGICSECWHAFFIFSTIVPSQEQFPEVLRNPNWAVLVLHRPTKRPKQKPASPRSENPAGALTFPATENPAYIPTGPGSNNQNTLLSLAHLRSVRALSSQHTGDPPVSLSLLYLACANIISKLPRRASFTRQKGKITRRISRFLVPAKLTFQTLPLSLPLSPSLALLLVS